MDDMTNETQEKQDTEGKKLKSQPKKKKRKINKESSKRILIIVGILICIVYLGGFLYYNHKFLSHTKINDIDVSNMTIDEAHQALSDVIDNQTLTLTFIDNRTETLTNKDAGISYNTNNSIQKTYNKQNHWLWFMGFFSDSSLSLKDITNVDEKKFDKTISNLKHLAKDQQKKPVDAKVVYKDQKFSIVKEDNGSTIDLDQFKKALLKDFQSPKSEVNVFNEKGYVLPKITSEDKQLNNLLDVASQYANVDITYDTVEGKVTLDGNEVMKWLSLNDDGEYYKDDKVFEEKATEFVKNLAKKINNIGTSKTIKAANGRTVTVSGGNYGLKLKQEKEIKGLLKDIKAGKKGEREPVTSGVQASTSNAGVGNTFAEVDLSNQKIYFVKNGQVVLTSACVTGKQSDPERRTPAGLYYIYFKDRDRILRGTRLPNGQWPYESHVDYWMAFNGGIGFHDATWRNKFGGNIYINSGSHGCVNLPHSVAQQLFGLIKVNTPVIVHW